MRRRRPLLQPAAALCCGPTRQGHGESSGTEAVTAGGSPRELCPSWVRSRPPVVLLSRVCISQPLLLGRSAAQPPRAARSFWPQRSPRTARAVPSPPKGTACCSGSSLCVPAACPALPLPRQAEATSLQPLSSSPLLAGPLPVGRGAVLETCPSTLLLPAHPSTLLCFSQTRHRPESCYLLSSVLTA